ncbi:MAG: NfeD family protein [Actinomycetota bacterium]|nr:NfeD family protein [Actinomycetota bacterium]
MGELLSNLKRTRRSLAALIIVVVALTGLFGSPAASHDGHDHSREIRIIEVSGLLDPIEIDYIDSQIQDAQRQWALAIVLQVNSPGSVSDRQEVLDLLQNIEGSLVPVGAWIGQSGATAQGAAAHLVQAADYSGIAPGSRIGNFAEFTTSAESAPQAGSNDLRRGEDAVEAGLVKVMAPTLGEFLLAMEDAELIEKISTEIEQADGLIQRSVASDVTVAFNKLSLLDQLFHTIASPAVTYLLFLAGMSLLLLDFFTGGIGVAGSVGCGSLLFGCYGLGVLDVRLWALVLLVIAMLGFAVDLQTGVPRFWTVVGAVLLIVGSLWLFATHSMSWLTLGGGIGLTLAFVLSGMPALIRTRYGTSTLGREWMVGKMTEAATDLSPDGLVVFENSQWRARVNRLTPIKEGESARIVGLEGLVLEVEPEEGGAVDYREMRQKEK